MKNIEINICGNIFLVYEFTDYSKLSGDNGYVLAYVRDKTNCKNLMMYTYQEGNGIEKKSGFFGNGYIATMISIEELGIIVLLFFLGVDSLDFKEQFSWIEIDGVKTDVGITPFCWISFLNSSEIVYKALLSEKWSPQEARSVLPNALKTEIVMTANCREWRHIFNMRAVGIAGKPHPQMLEIMIPLLKDIQTRIPILYDDLTIRE